MAMGLQGGGGVEMGAGDTCWGFTLQTGGLKFYNGSTVNTSEEKGLFYSTTSAMDYKDVHTKSSSEWIVGLTGGLGGGIILTSAESLKDFKNIAKTLNINLPLLSIGIGYGGKDISLSLSFGKSIGISVSNYDSETEVSNRK